MKKIISVSLVGLMLFNAMPVYALSKDEVVYSKLEENGNVKYTVVTEHLINDDNKENIIDYSDLEEIENTNGEETFKKDDEKIVWNASKKDIYYKGKSTKKLPVELNATYKLNGEEKSTKDMLGKKCKIEITLKYTNNDKHGNYYTPFVVGMEMTLDSKTTKNIKITNGKAISNGKSYIVAGISAPGLYESLGIEEIKDIDTIKISYETTKFELPDIYSVVTSKILDSVDLNNINEIENLYGKVDLLKTSSEKLVSGSKDLSSGISSLKNGIGELSNGTKLLNSSLSSAIAKIEASDAIDSETINSIKLQAKQAISSKFTEQYMASLGAQAISATIKTYQSNMNQIDEGIKAKTGGASADMVCQTPPTGLETYCAQYTSLKAMISQLSDSNSTLYKTIASAAGASAKEAALQTALSSSESVAKSVAASAKQTSLNSLKEINNNITKINNGLSSVNDGANKLNDGAIKLRDGLEKFNNEGINKIQDFVNNDLKNATTNIKELKKLAQEYNTFTKIDSNTKGETKFILVIDGQKVKEEKKQKKKTVKKETFGDKIINLFK